MSTLHAALAELAKECQSLVGRYTRAPGANGDRVADLLSEDTYRIGTAMLDLLAAHPAPDAGEVRLSEVEREALDAILVALWQCETEGGYEHTRRKVEAAVERILAARVDEAIEAALIVGATRTQPEGTERVEWGVSCDHERGSWRTSEAVAREEAATAAGESCHPQLVRRTITEYAPVVGPWEVVGDE